MFKEQCHFSKTGWSWSNSDGDGCSCISCPEPKSLNEIIPAQREGWKHLFTNNQSLETDGQKA